MDLHRKKYETALGDEKISLEVSRLAGKANAAVLGKHGNTAVLATVVMGNTDKQTDYFPLTVDYEERFYAAGKIMGSRFVRREGRPSDEATLSARLIDRTIRPLFDPRLRREVQVVITILAYDEKNDPDGIALLSASAALGISDIPWGGPVAGVKVQQISEQNVHYQGFFSGTKDKINMIEFEGKEIQEPEVVKLFSDSHKTIQKLIAFQEHMIKEIGKPKAEVMLQDPDPKLHAKIVSLTSSRIADAMKQKTLGDLKKEVLKVVEDDEVFKDMMVMADNIFEEVVNQSVHDDAIKHNKRPDGRGLQEVRELYGEIGLLERTHGSGLFIRGETQILAVTTLATSAAEQLVETMEFSGKRRFMLHYNFPAFSTGETGRSSRGPGRREIGHGALAAKAVAQLIPSKDEFPYTIRIVAETLSSNGSSSMASVCASSLSLMDAGVPIKKHIAGIAMGLMQNEKGEYKILTDIQGPEDHHGDMDLKVAGTEDGVAAIQMDVKIDGITETIFKEALQDAKKARLHILETLKKVISEPKHGVSKYAPTILRLNIDPEKIGWVIGPGGKTINGIIQSMNNEVSIDIDQTGIVYIASVNPELAERAMKFVEELVHEYKVGDIIEGNVIKILEFGAIVDLGGDQDGMIHISELKDGFVKKVEDVIRLGDHVKARVVRVEPEGRIALSLKNLG